MSSSLAVCFNIRAHFSTQSRFIIGRIVILSERTASASHARLLLSMPGRKPVSHDTTCAEGLDHVELVYINLIPLITDSGNNACPRGGSGGNLSFPRLGKDGTFLQCGIATSKMLWYEGIYIVTQRVQPSHIWYVRGQSNDEMTFYTR